MEDHESLKIAIQREVIEEVGIKVKTEDLNFVCLIDRKLKEVYKCHIFFKILKWEGSPINKEPNIHSNICWHKLNALPANLGPLALTAIEALSQNQYYYFRA